MKSLFLILTSFLFLFYSQSVFSAEAKQLFDQNCAMCHGTDGKAQTIIGKKYNIPDFTLSSWAAQNPAAKIKEDIENGHTSKAGQQIMRPFKGQLSQEEIDSLVSYIQSLSVAKGPTAE